MTAPPRISTDSRRGLMIEVPGKTMPTIRCETLIRAPVERCFDLTRSVDLHADSSTAIGARAIGGRVGGLSVEGDATVWSARFFGLRFSMTTRIMEFSFPTHFSDCMTHGLLKRFAHHYRFRPLPDGSCVLSDELLVEAPLGLLGRWVESFYLVHRMKHLVSQRLAHIKQVAESGDWQRYIT